jgi:hypothetical protein
MDNMKKVIEGKLYNTESAKLLLEWSDETGDDDATVEEALYYTKGGKFFLFGKGDSYSRYAQETSSGFAPGEKIVPLTEATALAWCKEHFSGVQYAPVFRAIEEGTVTVTFRVPPSVKDRFDKMKDKRGMTAGELLDTMLTSEEK